jgi:NitT/TauT family transport system ATP-binding protein
MQDFLLELWEADRKTVLLVTYDIDEAIYLADKTIVMSGHPARVHDVIDVDLPRPRHFDIHSDSHFIALRDQVRDVVHNEAAMNAATD